MSGLTSTGVKSCFSSSSSRTGVRVRIRCSLFLLLPVQNCLLELDNFLQVLSGAKASTSGRLPNLAPAQCHSSAGVQHDFSSSCSPYQILLTQARTQGTAGLQRSFVRGCPKRCKSGPTTCQAQKTQQESERPVMEQLETDLITGTSHNGNGSSNGAKSNGSRAPSKNSATNIADRTEDRPAEESQDEGDNNDSGAQSHSERSGGTPAKAASKVPGGVTEADNVSAPKPASFWLPHPEPGDTVPVRIMPQQCQPVHVY